MFNGKFRVPNIPTWIDRGYGAGVKPFAGAH